MMRNRKLMGWVALTFVLAALVAPVVHADDPFSSMESTISTSSKIWAGALVLIGALVAGGAIMFGSQNSGRHLGKFLAATAILLLTLKGSSLITWLSSAFGIGQ
jgi:hypothetical protein